jgi:hypothetical protein
MRAHGIVQIQERRRAFQEHRQEIQGKLPKGPFEFSGDLSFSDLTPSPSDVPVVRRFKLAVQRDARYAVASSPYLHIFGFSQALRSIYDGGGQIQDGEGHNNTIIA